MHGQRLTVRGQQCSRCRLVRPGGLSFPAGSRAGHDRSHLAGVAHAHHLAGQRPQRAQVRVCALPGLIDFTECRSAFMAGDLQRVRRTHMYVTWRQRVRDDTMTPLRPLI